MSDKLFARDIKELLKSLPQNAAADLVGMSARSFRDTDAPRNSDGSYDAKALVVWVQQRSTSDPLLVGDSPNLERYRAAKADLAEMDAAERRGQLVEMATLQEWWLSEVARPIKTAIERLQKEYSDGAALILGDSFAKAMEAIDKRGMESAAEPTEVATAIAVTSEAAADPGVG
jgi:hypothetical protein